MSSINKVLLMGNLARDPETRTFANGGMVTNLRLITNKSYKDRTTNERVERATGHNVSIYAAPTAKYAAEVLKKGDMVYVEGSIEEREWKDQEGNKRTATEISIRPYEGELKLIPTGRGGDASQSRADRRAKAAPTTPAESGESKHAAPADDVVPDFDSEIPF